MPTYERRSWNTTGPTTALTRLLQQQTSWAVSGGCGGGEYNKGKGKGNRKFANSKGYKGKGYQQEKATAHTTHTTKEKGKKTTLANKRQRSRQRKQRKGQRSNEGQSRTSHNSCRCGKPGHLARDCQVAVYKMSETRQEQPHSEQHSR